MKISQLVKYGLGFSWLGLVIYFFYENHAYYKAGLPGLLDWWPIWIVPLVFYGLFLMWTWVSESGTMRVKLSMPSIGFGIFLMLFFIGNITFLKLNPVMYRGPLTVIDANGQIIIDATEEQKEGAQYIFEYGTTIADTTDFYDQSPPELQQYLVRASFLQVQTGLIWTYIKVFGSTLVLLFVAWALGHLLHRFIRKNREIKEAEAFEEGATEMVLGLGISSTVLFLLGALHLFNLPAILLTFALLLAVSYKNTWARLKSVWTWSREIELKPSSMAIPAFLFLLTVIGIHLFDNLSPLPRGWDGLNRYVIIAKDLAEQGELLKRASVYGWELFMGLAYMLDIKLVLFWSALPGYLVFIFMWLLARRHSSSLGTALALSSIVVMPMMAFHLSDENKVDVAHWLYGTAAIFSFLKALNTEENPKKFKDHSYLWIAGLLAGFAFTVKFTGILIIFALLTLFAFVEASWLGFFAALLVSIGILSTQGGLGLGTEFTTSPDWNQKILLFGVFGGALLTGLGFMKKKIRLDSLKKLILLLMLIALPIMPWLAKNAVEIETLSFSNLVTGANDIPEIDFKTPADASCASTGFFEEYDRYIGYSDSILFRVISLPWHLTMNDTGAVGAYVDIGYTFLGFFLLALLFYKPSRHNQVIALFGLVYIFFWLIKANGVTWYGFPLFSFMAVLLAATYTKMSGDWVGRIGLIVGLGIWLVTGIDARLSNYGKVSLMLSHTKVISYDDVRESIFPYSNELNDVLAQNEGLLYKVGTPLGFFIPNYVKRSYDDQLIDNFNCLYSSNDQDFAAVRRLLYDIGFRYLLYDSFTNTVGLDPEGTLNKKVQLLEAFLDEQMLPVIYDEKRGHHLYQFPTEEQWEAYRDANFPVAFGLQDWAKLVQ